MRGFIPSLILFVGMPLLGKAEEFRVGAAAASITPPPGAPLAGYYSLREASGVLDDLFSKAFLIEHKGEKAALVVCDLVTLPRSIVTEARSLIEKEIGIPSASIMIAATHTHTGPVLTRGSARDQLDGGASDLGRDYTRELPGMIARSVAAAHANLGPARLMVAKTRVENLAYNRRFWMEDGTVGWNPPKLSPKIIAPAGPHDPEIGLLFAETLEEKPLPLFALINYAMHPDTTGGAQISADFPGVLARRLAEFKGPEMLSVFVNGACGNLNHRNVWWADAQKGPSETARLGNILAGAVCSAWPQLAPIIGAPLRYRSEMIKLPLPTITESELSEAREAVRTRAIGKAKFMEQVRTFRILDVAAREGEAHEVEVQVIAIGDEVAFVSLPGEVFVELGLAIKAASPYRNTFIVELANGSIGYIPNRSAYPEGNYEVVSARCAAGSGEMLVAAAVRMLRELKQPSSP